jgi:heavy metal sensor kinase
VIQLPRSIAGRLLFWQTSGVTIIMLILGVILYGEIKEIVFESMDNTLHSKARIFTGLIHDEHGTVKMELSDIIAGDYSIPRSGHYYLVLKGDAILAASPSLADNNFSFTPKAGIGKTETAGEQFFNAVGPSKEPVRVLQYRYTAFGDTFEIILAESMVEGIEMVKTFRKFLLIVLPIGILLLCFTAWWITRTALAPLANFTTIIERITHRNMDERLDTRETAQELSRLSSSFNAMLDRLNHVFESQKRLVADASHELKTPLTVIRTQCDVALLKERSTMEYNEAINAIRSETLNMTATINDLLSLARLDGGVVGSMKFKSVNIHELIKHAVRLTELHASRMGVQVTVAVDESLHVSGVQSALEEAILNLVENAIRYNHNGGDVQISAVQLNSAQVSIMIHDTGIGIAPEDREHIFERFYRAAEVRGIEGSGLGLSIVKAIIEAHDGEITVSSETEKGSRFTILLPSAPDEHTIQTNNS